MTVRTLQSLAGDTRARRRLLLPTLGAVLGLPVIALASPVDVPNGFAAGEVIDAERFNENFAAIANAINDNDARISALEGVKPPGNDVPSGAVLFFELDDCPAGFSPSLAMRGRVPIGLPSDGEVGATVGTALENEALRTISEVPSHSHTANPPDTATTAVANHTHPVDPPNTVSSSNGMHTHTVDIGHGGGDSTHLQGSNAAGDPAIVDSSAPIASAPNHTHSVDIGGFNSDPAGGHNHSVDIPQFNTGSAGVAAVDVTMPYMQLLACRKD